MPDANLQRYARFFEQLSADNLTQLATVMTEDIHFIDPFNDVRGLKQVEKVFAHMFDSLENARFTVSHMGMSDNEQPLGFLRWELNASLRGQPYPIIGMSEVSFAADGRVSLHIDHWDAARQFYERLPLVGGLLRAIRSRLTV
jgi:steroid delta-isomerase